MKISRCKICDSKFHLATRCPKRNDTRETIFIEERIVSLLAESFNVAIIDLACTKTVCSEVWMQYYTDSLSVSDKDKINICKSSNSFKFGKIKLTPDTTDYEIPLLLSKDSMKKVHATTDFKNYKMIMFQ